MTALGISPNSHAAQQLIELYLEAEDARQEGRVERKGRIFRFTYRLIRLGYVEPTPGDSLSVMLTSSGTEAGRQLLETPEGHAYRLKLESPPQPRPGA